MPLKKLRDTIIAFANTATYC